MLVGATQHQQVTLLPPCPATPRPPPTDCVDGMPAPARIAAPDLRAGLTAIQALLDLLKQETLHSGCADVQQKKADAAAQRTAEKEAREAQKHAETQGGFWSDFADVASTVGMVAGVVAACAAGVVTGGAATVAIAAVLLSVSGTVVSKTECFGDVSKEVGIGMQIGGAVLNAGSSISSAVSAAHQATQGAQAAAQAAKGAGTAQRAASYVKTGAQVVQGGATASTGIAQVEGGSCQRDATLAYADLTQARQRGERVEQLEKQVLEWAKAAVASNKTAQEIVQGARELDADITNTLVQGIRA